MRGLAFIFVFSMLLAGAVVLDRIAVIAGTHAIKTSDIDRDLRLTQFINRESLNISSAAKREAAERLITQDIIRQEIVAGGYRRPPDTEGVELEAQLRRDRFGKFRSAHARGAAALWSNGSRTPGAFAVADYRAPIYLPALSCRCRGHRRGYPELLPSARRRASEQEPKDSSLEALAPKIKATLEGERIDQNFNEWLDQARRGYRVEYKQEGVRMKILRRILIGAGVLIFVLALAAVLLVQTAWFRNYIKETIITSVEDSTGRKG